MLFTLVFVVVALIAITAVSLPLLSGVATAPERGQFDRAVYRDQLKELERDVARGVLSGPEAETARLEIQRRLLAVDGGSNGRTMRFGRSPKVAVLLSVLMLCGTTILYWHFGAPFLPDAPFSARPAAADPHADATPGTEHMDMREAATRLEQKLKTDPSNADGWVMLARTESMLGDWQKSADAYHRAIDLGEKTPDAYAGLGEMLVLSMNGIVAPAAHDAFTAALAADPKSDVARYYLALAAHQAGEEKQAIDAWLKLAADIPDDSPMREEIGNRIAEAAKTAGIAVPPLPKGTPAAAQAPDVGPGKDAMDTAAQMPEAQRKDMIRSMVDQLAKRLQTEPNDVDGWMRLGRAYAVLGETDKAEDAYDHAAKLKPGDADIRLQAVGMMLGGLKPDDPLPERAVVLLREVQAISPDEPEALWYLGIVAARGGHPDEARADWTKLLATLPPDGDDAKLVKSALGELK